MTASECLIICVNHIVWYGAVDVVEINGYSVGVGWLWTLLKDWVLQQCVRGLVWFECCSNRGNSLACCVHQPDSDPEELSQWLFHLERPAFVPIYFLFRFRWLVNYFWVALSNFFSGVCCVLNRHFFKWGPFSVIFYWHYGQNPLEQKGYGTRPRHLIAEVLKDWKLPYGHWTQGVIFEAPLHINHSGRSRICKSDSFSIHRNQIMIKTQFMCTQLFWKFKVLLGITLRNFPFLNWSGITHICNLVRVWKNWTYLLISSPHCAKWSWIESV